MKSKKISIVLMSVLMMLPTYSAQADQVIIEDFVTITYPQSIKLKKTGCQEITFPYVTSDTLPRENTAFLIAITPVKSKQTYGYAAWFSTQTHLGEKALPPMARIGSLKVKVCRKAFLYSSNSTKKTPAISPGVYRIHFDATYIDPETGGLIGEKFEEYRDIRFN